MKKIVLIVLIFVGFFSCKKENRGDCFKGNGAQTTEVRTLEPINAIEVYDNIEVNIYQSTEAKIEVNAGKNLLSNIKTKVKDGRLTIQNNNTCNFVRGYKKQIVVNVYAPYVKYLKHIGVQTISVNDFNQDTIYIRAENSGETKIRGNYTQISTSSHGNGTIYVTGTTNLFFGYMSGTNFLYAPDLKINNYAFVETISYGDTYLDLTNTPKFECNIWRDGNIYYKGNPSVINNFYNEEGKGELIKQD